MQTNFNEKFKDYIETSERFWIEFRGDKMFSKTNNDIKYFIRDKKIKTPFRFKDGNYEIVLYNTGNIEIYNMKNVIGLPSVFFIPFNKVHLLIELNNKLKEVSDGLV